MNPDQRPKMGIGIKVLFVVIVLCAFVWAPWIQQTVAPSLVCSKNQPDVVWYSHWFPFGRNYRTCYGDWYFQFFFWTSMKLCSGDGAGHDLCL